MLTFVTLTRPPVIAHRDLQKILQEIVKDHPVAIEVNSIANRYKAVS